MKQGLTTLAFLASLAVAAQAEITLDNLSLGEHWYGDNVAVEDMQGRVVMVEMWGRN
jgi:hypothetical protein